MYQFSVDDSKNIEYASLSSRLLRNGTHVFSTPWKTFGGEQIDYELHLGAKLDFLMYFNTKQLRHSELTLLQNQCEIERTQILTTLMLAMQNTRLAGYMLTGNRSMFLDTDGSVAWLYHCPKHLSPLRVLKKCYNRIPVYHKERTMFVDPMTCQTFDFAEEIACSGGTENAFQLDMDAPNTWYQLIPEPVHFKTPKLFEPHSIGHITPFSNYDTQRAGMYTPGQLKDFWDNVIHIAASKSVLKKITRSILTNGQDTRISESGSLGRVLSLEERLYLDSLLSPNFFAQKFRDTFGEASYIIQEMGNWFAVFLMIKFFLFIVIKVINTLEINQISAGTWNYAKVLLSGIFGIFHLSLVTSVYQQDQGNDQKLRNPTKIIVCAPPAVERSDDNRDKTQNLYPPDQDENVTLAPF